jgi:hypothetical protein
VDENKRAKLIDAAYRVLRTCGNCIHSDILEVVGMSAVWGTCRRWRYQHNKHTGEPRPLSVNAAGTCSFHVLRRNAPIKLGGFTPFLEPELCTCPECVAGELRSEGCDVWRAWREGRDGTRCHCGSKQAISARRDGTGKASVCAHCGLPWPVQTSANS